MKDSYLSDPGRIYDEAQWQPVFVLAEAVPEPGYEPPPPPPPRRRRVWLPLFLFVTTCLSTLLAGGIDVAFGTAVTHGLSAGLWAGLWVGLQYAVPVMTILLCHEMGHFLQAWRYGVYASWPYFIPMPFSPIGTFGAVIAMEARKGDRRALFDIGISGPLAGLVPTLIFLLVGLHWSSVLPIPENAILFGDPILVKLLAAWVLGPIPAGQDVVMHPMAFAGWVGLLVTALNLLPVGQLDGGHILYGMLRRKAHWVATFVLMASVVLAIELGLWHWLPMLALLVFVVGPRHPPTENDHVPLGWFRYLLGWLTLALLPLGFTPIPVVIPG